MQLNITFRNFDASEFLKDYAREKVERVNKYLDRAGEAHVVLSLERHLHHADITIHSGAFVLRGRDSSEDMYASLDLAMDKIERQLHRYKDRLKQHHDRHWVHHRQDMLREQTVRHNVVTLAEPGAERRGDTDGELVAGPRILKTNEFMMQAMNVEDAVMQMDLMNNEFFVFTNAKTLEMNVVYRRKDGEYGLIEAGAQAHLQHATRAAG